MTRKAWLLIGVSLLVIGLVVGCAGQTPPASQPAQAPKQAEPAPAPRAAEAPAAKEAAKKQLSVVRLADNPVGDFLIYHVIREKGFDAEFGIKVEGERFAAGPAGNEAMLAGAMDVTYQGTIPLIVAADRGLVPSKLIGVGSTTFSDPQHPLFGMIAAKSVNSFKDLEGKTVAVNQRGSLIHLSVVERLRREGVKVDSISFVELPPPNMDAALAKGDVAAISPPEPFGTQSRMRGTGKSLDWIVGKPPFDNFQVTIVTFNRAFYDKNPDLVKSFMKAQDEGRGLDEQEPRRSALDSRQSIQRRACRCQGNAIAVFPAKPAEQRGFSRSDAEDIAGCQDDREAGKRPADAEREAAGRCGEGDGISVARWGPGHNA
ncbi:MAG: NrtA/SsuA/CpmA family ABC transporter substrate-binding protein [Chloroflexi bacterium]|nr:NrtA/SsuA/CpmA family ABC transporter substrate-binding protein [Chloroflexota bacterium]